MVVKKNMLYFELYKKRQTSDKYMPRSAYTQPQIFFP
jgi:hypothetical protein